MRSVPSDAADMNGKRLNGVSNNGAGTRQSSEISAGLAGAGYALAEVNACSASGDRAPITGVIRAYDARCPAVSFRRDGCTSASNDGYPVSGG